MRKTFSLFPVISILIAFILSPAVFAGHSGYQCLTKALGDVSAVSVCHQDAKVGAFLDIPKDFSDPIDLHSLPLWKPRARVGARQGERMSGYHREWLKNVDWVAMSPSKRWRLPER